MSTALFITLPHASNYSTGYAASDYQTEPYWPYKQPPETPRQINSPLPTPSGLQPYQMLPPPPNNGSDRYSSYANKKGTTSHFDILRLQGHSYPPMFRPQTDQQAIVVETLQNPRSGNLMTPTQIVAKDVRWGLGGPADVYAREELLQSAGWYRTQDTHILKPPPKTKAIPAKALARGNMHSGYIGKRENLMGGFVAQGKKGTSHMTDYEVPDFGWSKPTGNLLNSTSARTYQAEVQPTAPWQPNYQHLEPLVPYQDYNGIVNPTPATETLVKGYGKYYDQTGRQMTGIAFDPNLVEADPQVDILPQNHPVIMRAKHDYATRVKYRVYPGQITQGIRDTVVADNILWRDLPRSMANA